jgi:hypothetical protein
MHLDSHLYWCGQLSLCPPQSQGRYASNVVMKSGLSKLSSILSPPRTKLKSVASSGTVEFFKTQSLVRL